MPNTFLVKAEQRSQYDEDMRVIYLSEVEVTAPIIKKEPRLDFWLNRSSDRTISREQIDKRHPALVADMLLGIAGITVSPDGDISIRGAKPPLVLIDGTIYDWPEYLSSPFQSPVERFNVNMVESIDIIMGPRAAILGVRGTNGAISITTRRGEDVPEIRRNIAVLTPLGFQRPVAFYSPKYDTPEAKHLNIPDYRTTIYWKPDVIISDEHEAADIEFYTSDFSTTYSVVIEGLTTEGKIVRQVKEIVVE